MTRDDIIKLAREAGLVDWMPFTHQDGRWWIEAHEPGQEFERFAALVAAAERDRLHDKFMEIHRSQQHSNNYWHFAARKIKEEA